MYVLVNDIWKQIDRLFKQPAPPKGDTYRVLADHPCQAGEGFGTGNFPARAGIISFKSAMLPGYYPRQVALSAQPEFM